jgi:hypothetical protein
MVLTVRNADTPEELAERTALIWRTFSRARRWACWAKRANGKQAWGVVALEITWHDENGYHAHLHVLFDGRFKDLAAFQQKWMRAVDGKHWPHIERLKGKGEDAKRDMLHEVLKYVLKPGKTIPEEVEGAILSVIDHKRTFRSFGGLRAEDEDQDGEPLACPCCGTERTSATEHEWSLSLVLDEDLATLEGKHPGFVFRGWRPKKL